MPKYTLRRLVSGQTHLCKVLTRDGVKGIVQEGQVFAGGRNEKCGNLESALKVNRYFYIMETLLKRLLNVEKKLNLNIMGLRRSR